MMKFTVQDHDSLKQLSTLVYRAPIAGTYEVNSRMTRLRRTGRFFRVPNARYRWWTFWRPKTRMEEQLELISEASAKHTLDLVVGQVVDGSTLIGIT